jgi:hypothetical protein
MENASSITWGSAPECKSISGTSSSSFTLRSNHQFARLKTMHNSCMIYDTVVADLFTQFPKLQSTYRAEFAYMGTEKPGAYLVFGSLLMPALERALAAGDLGSILPICAFLEEVAEAAQNDISLRTLLEIEVGEWLGWAANEASLAPWLGTKTKRVCGYVPGLATQRIALRAERDKLSFEGRISSLLTRARSK